MKFFKKKGKKGELTTKNKIALLKAYKKKSIMLKLMKIGAFFASLSMAVQMLMFIMMLCMLLFAGATILNFFSKEEEDILEKYKIPWEEFTCTCTFLTAEEIDIVKAGGQVAVTPDNSGGLNVSGGSVAGGGEAQGLKIPSMGQAKTDTQYGIPIWTGYSMSDTGQDMIVPISTDTRKESKVYTSQSGAVADTMTIAERANQGIVSTESFSGSTVRVDNGRLAVAVGSGFIAWPDDPDHSSTMIGLNFDVVLKNGEVIPCVAKDAKANVHTGDLHMFYAGGNYRANIPAEKRHIDAGTSISVADYSFLEFMSCPREAPSWLKNYIVGAGGIDHVKVYNYGRGEAAAKTVNPNAFDASKMVTGGNAGGNNTSSFGGGGAGQVVNNGDTIQGLSATASANANQCYTILTGLGYSPAAALGIMGNIWQETTFNPNLWGPGCKSGTWESKAATYYTLTQTNKSNLPQWVAWLNTQGLSIDTVEGQIKGLDWTMSVGPEKNLFSTYPADNYKISLEQFKALTDPILACDYFMTAYERATGGTDPSTTGKSSNKYQHLENRKNYTRTLMNHFGVSAGSSTIPSAGTGASGNTGSTVVESTGGTSYTDGEKISLDSSWKYAENSVIHTGQATYYKAKGTPKNICVTVNAGHGCSGGGAKQTLSHPDGTAKVTGGTTAAGNVYSTAISSGMEFKDGTAEAVVNLKIAKLLKDELLNRGYDVLMIRETNDEQLDNIARTVISNNIADAHLAIHFDSSESDKGAFYMSVPNIESYRNMSPVKETWQEHTKFGEALMTGLVNNGYSKYNGGSLEQDLTQTSYSTIPSIDIELGDKITPHEDADCAKFSKALADGVDEYFRTATPMNQGKRAGSSLSAGGSVSGNGGALGNVNTAGNTVSGVVNKNTANLRTHCCMKSEGICGCYISDPNCACHVFGGSDGVLGTGDDNLEGEYRATDDTGQGANLQGLSAEQSKVIDACRVVMDAYMTALKDKYPINYEGGWTWTSGTKVTGALGDASNGPWYGQSGGSAYWYINPVVNGVSYGTARNDCSSYSAGVLRFLGADWASPGYSSAAFTATGEIGRAAKQDDRFIVISGSNLESQVQPGDIVRRVGHVEVCYQVVDAAQNQFKAYSWGSTSSVQRCYDLTTRQLLPEPVASPTSHYEKATTIIRYVGSGGAGR